jgi:hypothetical protein
MKPSLHTIETGGTLHLKCARFIELFELSAPGAVIHYATGDLGFSANHGFELVQLRHLVWKRYEDGICCLTQKPAADGEYVMIFPRAPGRAFDYFATKRERPQKKDAIVNLRGKVVA